MDKYPIQAKNNTFSPLILWILVKVVVGHKVQNGEMPRVRDIHAHCTGM